GPTWARRPQQPDPRDIAPRPARPTRRVARRGEGNVGNRLYGRQSHEESPTPLPAGLADHRDGVLFDRWARHAPRRVSERTHLRRRRTGRRHRGGPAESRNRALGGADGRGTMRAAVQEIRPGVYRHYKGMMYEVIGVAKHSEVLEDLVVYRALYGDH